MIIKNLIDKEVEQRKSNLIDQEVLYNRIREQNELLKELSESINIPKTLKEIKNLDENKILSNYELEDFKIDFLEIIQRIKGTKILEIGSNKEYALNSLSAEGYETARIGYIDNKILDYPDKFFDTVYSMHLLENLKECDKAIEESLRISKCSIIHLIQFNEAISEAKFRELAEKYTFCTFIYPVSQNKENGILFKFLDAK